MKNLKTVKTGITGGLCMAIGAAVFLIGFAASGFKFDKLSSDKYDNKTMTVSGNTKEIQISENDTNINISKSDDNDIHISYFENKNEKYNISDGETLKIKKHSSRKITFGINTQIISLDIQIPEKCNASIKIDSNNGNITTKDISPSSCSISVNDGNINMDNCSVDGKTDISTDSGNLRFSGSKFNGDFKIKTEDGNVTTQNCEYKEKTDLKTDCGNVTFKDVACASELSIKTSDGNVDTSDGEYKGKTKIKTDCGNVTVDKITCDSDLTITTGDGNVRGTINGKSDDFNIISNTKDGNNNLDDKNNKKDKTLSVKTDCGNIKLQFD